MISKSPPPFKNQKSEIRNQTGFALSEDRRDRGLSASNSCLKIVEKFGMLCYTVFGQSKMQGGW
jgi:hypothetical protein